MRYAFIIILVISTLSCSSRQENIKIKTAKQFIEKVRQGQFDKVDSMLNSGWVIFQPPAELGKNLEMMHETVVNDLIANESEWKIERDSSNGILDLDKISIPIKDKSNNIVACIILQFDHTGEYQSDSTISSFMFLNNKN
jgi:hypothetical protein